MYSLFFTIVKIFPSGSITVFTSMLYVSYAESFNIMIYENNKVTFKSLRFFLFQEYIQLRIVSC